MGHARMRGANPAHCQESINNFGARGDGSGGSGGHMAAMNPMRNMPSINQGAAA